MRDTADQHGLNPQQAQAIMWTHWRNVHPPSEKSTATKAAQTLTDKKYGKKAK